MNIIKRNNRNKLGFITIVNLGQHYYLHYTGVVLLLLNFPTKVVSQIHAPNLRDTIISGIKLGAGEERVFISEGSTFRLKQYTGDDDEWNVGIETFYRDNGVRNTGYVREDFHTVDCGISPGDKVIFYGISSESNGLNPCSENEEDSGEDFFELNYGDYEGTGCVRGEIPLPIDIKNFMLACENDGQQVRINVTTASEKNNAGFWIQRSKDGKTWENIAFVNAYGDGNSTEENHYSTIIQNEGEESVDGVVYYRLEQLDRDGKSNFSDIKFLRDCSIKGEVLRLNVYPNPAGDLINLQLHGVTDHTEAQTVNIFNSIGQAIGTVSLGDDNTAKIDISEYLKGGQEKFLIFQVVTGNGSRVTTQKVVIQGN